jgi:Tfp pilus assembly protein PilF
MAMNERTPLDATVDIPSDGDSLDAGLAAAFGPDSGPPLPAGGSVLQALSAGLPSVPRILLREPDSFGGSPIIRPSSEEMPDKQDPAASLQLHGEIARGGMGAVLKGRDVDLGRDVAVKVLLETHQGKTEMLQRFVEEAQISGQLQHPGITPVYELGQFADKRPYFTMKLVKGKTLATLLAARKSPAEEQSRYVGIFAQICQTLAYAHARGVIHRDLKPSNVMVGAFGEVQVMDWGLAKVLKEGGIADEQRSREREPVEVSVIRTQRSAGSSTPEVGSNTQAGTVLGTPAFMAPEQARGEVELVDERADVFGLGAILCVILTGQPPYVGKQEEIAYKARKAKLEDAFARLEGCGADAELIALTERCLAAELLERPRHAGEVAEQVAAYQQSVTERLRLAELAETEARARAEEESKTRVEAEARLAAEHRARQMTLGLAAAVLLVLTLAGGGAWWQQWKQEQADTAVEKGLAGALKLAKLAQETPLQAGNYQQALEEAQVAAELAKGASDTLRKRADELVARLEREKEAAERDRRLLTALLEVHNPREGPKFKPDDEGLMNTLAEPSAEEQFASAFRDWGLDVDAVQAKEAAALLKARPAAVVTEVVAALDAWASQPLQHQKAAAARVAELAAALDDNPSSLRRELREILKQHQLPVEHALSVLSAVLRPVPVPVQVPLGKDQLRLRQLAVKTDPSVEPILGLLTLTRALRMAGDEALAERVLRAALIARPHELVLYHILGEVLTTRKPPRWGEAVVFYQAARALRPDLGVNLAQALMNSGHAREGLDLLARMVHDSPNNPYLHFQRGFALLKQERYAEAEAAYRQAIELKPDYALAYNNLGKVLHDQGRVDEAIAEYQKAIQLDPKIAMAHANLGGALYNKGRVDEAMTECQKALELDPKNAIAHNNLGLVLERKGRWDEGIAEYQQAIKLDPKFAIAHNNLGNSLKSKGQVDEAIAEYQKALELDPKYAHAHSNLGIALVNKGRMDEAIAEFQAALEMDPKNAKTHNGLGAALRNKGRMDEAIASCKKAIELDPKFAEAHNGLGMALHVQGLRHVQGRLDEAIAEYQKAIELDPKNSAAHNNLAGALLYYNYYTGRQDGAKGRLDEAVAGMKKALELDPKDAVARDNLARWEPVAALQSKLPAFLEGKFQPRDNAERIHLAQLCFYRNYHRAAAQLYADAYAAEPKQADDLRTNHRYDAACAAALAGCGDGTDAKQLDDKERARWRKQALDWLRADLALWTKQADSGKPIDRIRVAQKLRHWQSEADFASIHDANELAKLPGGERQACEKLWADVAALLKKAQQTK